jgi:hypothetical protein
MGAGSARPVWITRTGNMLVDMPDGLTFKFAPGVEVGDEGERSKGRFGNPFYRIEFAGLTKETE